MNTQSRSPSWWLLPKLILGAIAVSAAVLVTFALGFASPTAGHAYREID